MKGLTFRLLFFNLLLAIFPVGAILFLGTYEKQLLDSQERAMVQQGRILAAGLTGENLETEARKVLTRLGNRTDARLRVLDTLGRLLADSALIAIDDTAVDEELTAIPRPVKVDTSDGKLETPALTVKENTEGTGNVTNYPEESVIYRLGAIIPRFARRISGYFQPPIFPADDAEYYIGKEIFDGPEVLAALEGRYGAATRFSQGQISITLYSAIPIFRNDAVVGAVLVSRSTFAILNNLYQLRLNIMTIFLLGVGGAVILSIFLARTVTVPVGRLRKQAESLLDERGKMLNNFEPLKGSSEIAALSLALHQLSTRVQDRTQLLEEFIADLAHEMKNPVAGILSASELASQTSWEPQSSDTRHFLETINREGRRIEHLLNDLRELISLDVNLDREGEESVDVRKFINNLVDPYLQRQRKDIRIECNYPEKESQFVKINPERLAQAVLNLLDNAVSFSPEGGCIKLNVKPEYDTVCITIRDQGPGIKVSEQEKIFRRWYSDRPPEEASHHTGLGLAIVQGIAVGYGGSISVSNSSEGGAEFFFKIPRFP